jgi:hypothetical protein
VPKAFEAFTRLDATRRDCLGIGLFIVCQTIAASTSFPLDVGDFVSPLD